MVIEQVENDSSSRIFYSSYHFYIIYQFFIFLYERFNFAYIYAIGSPVGLKLYETFKQLVFMNIFGVLDENNYEDSIRMIFDYHSGIFLNFERILTGCLKHACLDEFSNFILSLNPQIFGEKTNHLSFSESVIFAKTCFKLNEMTNKDNKGYKTNAFSAFNNNYNLCGNELVKFEFNKTNNLFLIHKIKSMFTENRKDFCSNTQIIENNYSVLTRIVPTTHKRLAKNKKQFINNLTYVFELKKKAIEVKSGETEDQTVGDDAQDIRENARSTEESEYR